MAAAEKPNIIFILVDDLGWADVGFNGSTYYETPNLDHLATESLVFQNAYMYPTCSPSRTAVATGLQSFRTGVYTVPVLEKGDDQENIFSRWTVGEEHIMYSQPMADAGYKSIFLGKWHLVGPYPEREFSADFPLKKKLEQPVPDDFSWVEKHRNEYVKYYPTGRGYLKNIGGTYRGDPALEAGGYSSETGGFWAPFNNPFMDTKNPDDQWLTDHLTTKAIEFIDEHKAGPFLVDLHYYTVHKPLRARSQELLEKYLAKPGDPVTGQGMSTGEKHVNEATYATMIESLDDNIGRIVDYLDQNNLRENTIIIFTSDNGQNQTTNNLLRGEKGEIYEGGIRVPTLINWQAQIEARRTETPISGLDFFPTFMDVSNIPYSGLLDGHSLTPLFQGESKMLEERPLFWQLSSRFKHGTCSVIRKGDMKLIQFLSTGELELYDLKEDPKETKNLVKTMPELAQQMVKELTDWRAENNVPLPPNAVMPH